MNALPFDPVGLDLAERGRCPAAVVQMPSLAVALRWCVTRTAIIALAWLMMLPASVTAQEVPAVAHALDQAWSIQNVEAAVVLFHDDAAIVIDLGGLSPPAEYRGARGIDSLPDGVASLMGSGPHLDLGSAQVIPTIFGGSPATTITWAYRGNPGPLNLPPVAGRDEVVIQDGRIVSYTRRPDYATVAVRGRALASVSHSLATRTARSEAAAAGGAGRGPDTQGRGTPAVAQWAFAVALLLTVVVAPAMFKRPSGF
jgi:hypothetical protein